MSQVPRDGASVLAFEGFFRRVFTMVFLRKTPKSNLALFLKTVQVFAIETQSLFSGEMAD